jgi:hypothetical protein
MENLTAWALVSATVAEREAVAEQIVDQACSVLRPKLVSLVASFLAAPVNPTGFLSFELGLIMLVRELPDDAGEDSVSILPALVGEAAGPLREATVHHSINGSFAIRKADGSWRSAPIRADGASLSPAKTGQASCRRSSSTI